MAGDAGRPALTGPTPSPALWWTLLAYLTLLGGTPSGEFSGWIRPVNGAIALGLMLVWVRGLGRDHDWMDRTILVAVLIFLVASLASLFPRQSLDAALQVLALAAALWIARRHLAHRLRRPNIEVGMGWLAVGVSVLIIAMWAIAFLAWAVASGWRTVPPLNLPLPTGTLGHQHDVAILVCLLVPAVWSPAFRSRWPAATWIASILTAIIVLLDGSRNVQLAILLAFGLTLAPRGWPGRFRWTNQRWRIAALSVVLVLLVVAAPLLLSRLANFTTLGSRFSLWADSVAIWLQHPVSGIGPGAFPFAFLLSDHFGRSAFDPRHPDNAVIQVMVEAGLLGLIALAIVVASILAGAVRTWRREPRASWAVAVFALTCIGANSSDFLFLITPAIIWVAILTPPGRIPRPATPAPAQRGAVVRVAYGLVALIAVAVISTSTASILYEVARGAFARGDSSGTTAALRLAVVLDPAQSLYWREKASVELASGDLVAAEADYRRAISIGPHEPVALRGLALTTAARGNYEDARAASNLAVDLNSIAIQNQIVVAVVAAQMGDSKASDDALSSVIAAEPELAAAPWTSTVLDGFDRRRSLQLAALSEAQGGVGPMMVALLVPGTDVQAKRGDIPAGLRNTADALIALAACDVDRAWDIILAAESAEREDSGYWLARALIATALDGNPQANTELALKHIRGYAATGERGESLLADRGDPFRYRREPIAPVTPATAMPSRSTGWLRLLSDPGSLTESLGGSWPPNCPPA